MCLFLLTEDLWSAQAPARREQTNKTNETERGEIRDLLASELKFKPEEISDSVAFSAS